ncbi:MAG: DNA polymerase III subunit delta [Clostridia bacterium]|nr:DNA polymerase III subunit delta [Clostridia bacterium]
MTTVTFLNLKNSLKEKVAPVYVVSGNDGYLVNKAVQQVVSNLDIQNETLNLQTFTSENTFDEIMMSVATLPFFSNQKGIVAYDVANAKVTPSVAKKMCESLEKFIRNADGSVCLVLVTQSAIFDKLDVVKVVCDRLSRYEVVRWITQFCKREKVEIDDRTAGKIADYCLCDMSRISLEAKKLCDYCQEKITEEDVELHVHKDTEFVVFNLANAISAGDASKSMQVLDFLFERGEKAHAIFGALYSTFRRMYYLRTSNYSTQQLAQFLGVKENSFYHVRDSALSYKPMQLRRALRRFHETSKKLATFANEKETIRLLVFTLLSL